MAKVRKLLIMAGTVRDYQVQYQTHTSATDTRYDVTQWNTRPVQKGYTQRIIFFSPATITD